MTNFKILVKYNFLKFINVFRGKNKNKPIKSGVILMILACLGILAIYTLQAYSMFLGLAPLGLAAVCMFHAYMIAIIVLAIFSIMRITTNKKSEDDDFLISLPLTKSQIILSKGVTRYLLDFAISFVLIVPFLILYLIYAGFNIATLVFGLISVFLLPLFSIGLSYIFNFLVSNLFNKLKNSKIYKSLFSTLIFIALFILLYAKGFNYGAIDPNNLDAYFSDRFITQQFLNFTLEQSILSIIVVLAFCLGPFLIGFGLYVSNYGKENSGYKAKNKPLKFNKKTSPLKMLFKKELNTYVSTPAYFINTIIGPILILILGVLVAIFAEDIAGFASMMGAPIWCLASAVICLIIAMSSTTCCSVSLEGKAFWILKTSPISVKHIFLSKILLNYTVLIIPIISSVILIGLSLKLAILEFLALFLLCLVFALLVSIMGLVVNLIYPKMDWKDEAQAVKQSMSTLLTMLFGWLLVLIPVIIVVLLPNLFTIQTVGISCLVVYSILVIGLIMWLSKRGENHLSKIEV